MSNVTVLGYNTVQLRQLSENQLFAFPNKVLKIIEPNKEGKRMRSRVMSCIIYKSPYKDIHHA